MQQSWTDINLENSNKLQEISYQIAKELLEEGFSEEVIYTLLHKTVGVGLYDAIVEYSL